MSASVVLEWRNLNLTIKKREFKWSKSATQIEEKCILDNGNANLELNKNC